MKKILAVFITLMFSLLLVSCGNGNLDDITRDNQEIKDSISNLEERQNQINSKLDEILGMLSDVVDNTASIEEIQTTLDNLLAIVAELESKADQTATDILELNNIISQIRAAVDGMEIDKINDNLIYIKNYIIRQELINFIDNEDLELDYKNLFLEKMEQLLEEGTDYQEILSTFNKDYDVDKIISFNEINDLNSIITVYVPEKLAYDSITISIKYHGEVLYTHVYTTNENITIDFSAPNYGGYILESSVKYGDKILNKEHNFGVTTQHYNLAVLNGTLPVLMFAAEHIATMDESPTYISLGRPQTYNWDYLPENTFRFPNFIRKAGDYRYEGVDQISKWVHELHLANPESTFTLNVVDNYIGIAITIFDRFEIPEEVYNVKIWTDGTFTDTALNSYNEKFYYARQQSVLRHRENTKGILAENIDYNQVSSETKNSALAYASIMDNVEYIVSGLGGVRVTDQVVLDAIDQFVTVRTIPGLFDNLMDSGNINSFEYLLGTRWGEEPEEGLSHLFNSPKGKYILILGTSTAGENPTGTNKYYTFNEYLDILEDLYGDEYEIFYKGHPAYPSNEERQTIFADKNISELRNSIPVEIMMYIYPNVYVGGYRGSSFLSSKKDQTLFFFGPETFIKGQATLKDMIENTDVFDNTVYLFDENK